MGRGLTGWDFMTSITDDFSAKRENALEAMFALADAVFALINERGAAPKKQTRRPRKKTVVAIPRRKRVKKVAV